MLRGHKTLGALILFLLLCSSAFCDVAKDVRISDNDGDVLGVNADGTIPVSISGNLATPGDLSVLSGQFVLGGATIASDATSFSAVSANVFTTSCNTVPTAITAITGATANQMVHIFGGCDVHGTSIDDVSPFKLSAAIRLSRDDSIILRVSNDGTFIQTSRADN